MRREYMALLMYFTVFLWCSVSALQDDIDQLTAGVAQLEQQLAELDNLHDYHQLFIRDTESRTAVLISEYISYTNIIRDGSFNQSISVILIQSRTALLISEYLSYTNIIQDGSSNQ